MFPSHVALNGNPVPLITKRNRRARRIILRFCPTGQSITLVYPWRTSAAKALAFLHSKESWLAAQWQKIPEKVSFQHGKTLPVLGKQLTICHIHQARGLPFIEGDSLTVPCLPEFLERRVGDFLTQRLKEEITLLTTQKSAHIGKTFRRITIRSMTTRWGSCTSDGNLAFARNLVFAPFEVLDYLVSHEVAHLKEMNHSRRFWQTVATLCPDYQVHREWLHHQGALLHFYGW